MDFSVLSTYIIPKYLKIFKEKLFGLDSNWGVALFVKLVGTISYV